MKATDELVKIAFDWYNGGKEIKDEIYNEDWVGMFKNSPKYEYWEKVNGVSTSKEPALNLDIVSNSFFVWWQNTGSSIRPLDDDDYETHAKRVCSEFIKALAK